LARKWDILPHAPVKISDNLPPCAGKNIGACIVLKKENDFFDFRRSNLVEI